MSWIDNVKRITYFVALPLNYMGLLQCQSFGLGCVVTPTWFGLKTYLTHSVSNREGMPLTPISLGSARTDLVRTYRPLSPYVERMIISNDRYMSNDWYNVKRFTYINRLKYVKRFTYNVKRLAMSIE